MKRVSYILLLFSALTLGSCSQDFLQSTDSSSVTDEELEAAVKDDGEAILAPKMTGMYESFQTNAFKDGRNGVGYESFMRMMDIMGNDQSWPLGTIGMDQTFLDHKLAYTNGNYNRASQIWSFYYTIIRNCNGIVDLVNEGDAKPSVKRYLAEAYALRGYCYYILAMCYQKAYTEVADPTKVAGVPLYLSRKKEAGKIRLSRGTLAGVYDQAVSDLKEAIRIFDGWSNNNDKDRELVVAKTHIDSHVANGLLSRVYLAMGKWNEAAAAAHAARQGYRLFTPQEVLEDGFQDLTSAESMWGVHYTQQTNLGDGSSHQSFMCSYNVGWGGQVTLRRWIDASLYTKLTPTDVRLKWFLAPGQKEHVKVESAEWDVDQYCNKKFKAYTNWVCDVVYMRVSEMYLTEAEALARAGRSAEALAVMKEFMAQRDPAWNATAVSGDDVYQQRRLELWGEGFSFLDHKRLHIDLVRKYVGTNEPVECQINIPAGDNRWTWQIPITEIRDNDSISGNDQNPL